MFHDKRWLIPIFSLILLVYQYLFTWDKLTLVFILALFIYKSYHSSLVFMLKQHKKIVILALIYHLFSYFFIQVSAWVFLLHVIKFITTLFIALMLNKLLNSHDIIASIELYLRPFKKTHWSADLAIIMILMRHYLVRIKYQWRYTQIIIRIRYHHRSVIYQWQQAIQHFLFAIMQYPSISVQILSLRNYHQHFCVTPYPQKKSDILYFFLLCGILMVVSIY